MDISYLLWLQDIRESLPGIFEQCFLFVSAIANSPLLILLPCVLYWCLDKRAGQYLLFTFSVGLLLNQFIKNTVCCYRPWVRDAAVHPSAAALPEATGYSFPSGHTVSAATLVGGVGWYFRRRWRGLLVGCVALVLLVAFSRNFLGVHTPQDVVVGLMESAVVVLAVERALAWVDEHPGEDRRILAASVVIVVAYVAYVFLKPYPLDFDANGALLVDPTEMQVDCFKAAGVFAGGVLGWFLERRFLSFEVDPRRQGAGRLAVRLALGIAVVAVCYLAPSPLKALMDVRWYELVKKFLAIFAAAFLGPAAFCAVEHARTTRAR